MSISYCSLDEAWGNPNNASINEDTNYTGGNSYNTDMKSVLRNRDFTETNLTTLSKQYHEHKELEDSDNKPYQNNIILQNDNDRNKQIVPASNQGNYLNCLNYTSANNNFIDKSIMLQQLMLLIQRMEKKIDKLENKVEDEENNEKSKVIESFGNMENNSIMDYVILVFMGIVIIFVMDSIMKMGRKS
jgi:hypothetical protein